VFPDPNRRGILTLDGGGVRGIITLHALRAMEGVLGRNCFDALDGFAGTSIGAIIAAALAAGRTVEELIALYRERRHEIFSRSLLSYVMGPLATRYRKGPIHQILRDYLGDVTLAELGKDIFITATDTVRSETTYFTAFTQPDGTREGFYRELPLRYAVEASLSAPTYFPPTGGSSTGASASTTTPPTCRPWRRSASRARPCRAAPGARRIGKGRSTWSPSARAPSRS
jgi:patatin-like phospholipase/acyl hydrolase